MISLNAVIEVPVTITFEYQEHEPHTDIEPGVPEDAIDINVKPHIGELDDEILREICLDHVHDQQDWAKINNRR